MLVIDLIHRNGLCAGAGNDDHHDLNTGDPAEGDANEVEGAVTPLSNALKACLDFTPSLRSEIAIYTHISRETLARQAKAALGLEDESGGNAEDGNITFVTLILYS